MPGSVFLGSLSCNDIVGINMIWRACLSNMSFEIRYHHQNSTPYWSGGVDLIAPCNGGVDFFAASGYGSCSVLDVFKLNVFVP